MNSAHDRAETIISEALAILTEEGIALERDGYTLTAPWGTKFAPRTDRSSVLGVDRSGVDLADRVRGSKRLHEAAARKRAQEAG